MRYLAAVCCFICSNLLLTTAFAGGNCAKQEAVTSFGERTAPGPTLTATNWSQEVKARDGFQASSFRVALKVDAGEARNWHIVVRDPSMRALAMLGPKDFNDEHGKMSRTRWTGRLQAKSMRVELMTPNSSAVKAEVVEVIAYQPESSDVQLFSVIGDRPAWKPLYPDGNEQKTSPKRAGDTVAILLAGAEDLDSGQRLSWCCSGVMLSPDLLLTNWHCGGHPALNPAVYWNKGVCDGMLVDLAWDGDPDKQSADRRSPSNRQFGCLGVVAKDRRLDYALIRLGPVVGAGGSNGEAIPAKIETKPIAANDPVFLLHHAQCSPKLISKECAIRAPAYKAWWSPSNAGDDGTPDLTHNCDSEPGASGAPLFSLEGRLVGLHHTGFDRDEQCNKKDSLNKAVRIGEILRNIEANAPSAYAEIKNRW